MATKVNVGRCMGILIKKLIHDITYPGISYTPAFSVPAATLVFNKDKLYNRVLYYHVLV